MFHKPTIIDVAKRAKVSKSTVARVLSGKTYGVGAKSKERVVQAVRDLKYIPNTLASGLRTSKTKTIILIIPSVSNIFWAEVARGVQDTLDKEGYNLVLANSDWNVERERRYLQMAESSQVDAILINAPHMGMEEFDVLKKIDCPVVLIGDHEINDLYPVVATDNYLSVKKALDYLYEIGHRDIAFAYDSRLDVGNFSCSRIKGYREFFSEKGISLRSDLIFQVPMTMMGGKQLAEKVKNISSLPTALLCTNDILAFGFMNEAKSLGLSIPGDISVIGMDGIAFSEVISPKLTTISKNKYEIGRLAAAIVLKEISGKNFELKNKLDTELLVRESTIPIK